MKHYVFTQTPEGKETIHYESKSNDNREAEKECREWVEKNGTEFKDHWEINGEWAGICC